MGHFNCYLCIDNGKSEKLIQHRISVQSKGQDLSVSLCIGRNINSLRVPFSTNTKSLSIWRSDTSRVPSLSICLTQTSCTAHSQSSFFLASSFHLELGRVLLASFASCFLSDCCFLYSHNISNSKSHTISW